jgi:hypothetical protein
MIGYLVEPRLSELPLDVKLPREAVTPVSLDAHVARLPRRIRCACARHDREWECAFVDSAFVSACAVASACVRACVRARMRDADSCVQRRVCVYGGTLSTSGEW